MTPTKPTQAPSLGRDVWYRSRTDDYTLAAKIVRNNESSSPEAVERSREHPDPQFHLGDLDDGLGQVDLVVFTPGPGCTYRELGIVYDPDGAPGTWRWFTDAS